MRKFGAAERRIAGLLQKGQTFSLGGHEYKIVISGKPTCREGEPKTDIFVGAVSRSGGLCELKISFKKKNADFLENKTTAERAERLFGNNWERLVTGSTLSIRESFFRRPLIYKESFGRTEKGSITLGWKFEILNKPGGDLSGPIDLSRQQVIDVYAGTSLPEDKRNASVCGQIIEDSGVANCILFNGDFASVQEIIDELIPIVEYVEEYPEVYFACKALNYRTFKGKYDGNRPLAVFVHWRVQDERLVPELVFNRPLLVRGDEVADNLRRCLSTLDIEDTDGITPENVRYPQMVFGL